MPILPSDEGMRGLGGPPPLYLAAQAAAWLTFWTAWFSQSDQTLLGQFKLFQCDDARLNYGLILHLLISQTEHKHSWALCQ